MRRFLLTSCATSLVLAVMAGSSASAQQVYNSTQAVNGPITDGTSPTAVQVTGGATVTLTNPNNSYSGGTLVNGGSTVAVDQDSELGKTSGALSLGDSGSAGTLLLNNSGVAFTSNRSIILGSGGATIGANPLYLSTITQNSSFLGTISGAGALTISGGSVHFWGGANSYLGGTTINGGATLYVTNDNQLGNAGGAITLGDANNQGGLAVQDNAVNFASSRGLTINGAGGVLFGPNSPSNPATYNGVVAGTGLLVIGGGTVALTNSGNSWVGGTAVINGARLQTSSDAALGGGLATSVQLGNATSGGALEFTASAAAPSTARQINLGVGGGTLINSSGNVLTVSGTIADAATNTSGAVNAGGSLTISGANAVALTGNNTFTGNLTVDKNATLVIGSDNALGGYSVTSSVLTGYTSYTLSTTPNSLILNNNSTLAFSAGTTIQHAIQLNGAATVDVGGQQAVIQTSLTQSTPGGSLTVTNSSTSSAGSLVLDGVNNYTGGTTVSGGAEAVNLVIGDSNAPKPVTLNGPVTVGTAGIVSTAGVLGSTTTIAGALINQGGTVAPASVLTALSYTQSSGTLSPVVGPETALYSTGSNQALLQVSGNANITGGLLAPTFAQGFLRAGRYLVFSANSLTGSGFATEALTVPSIGLTGQIVQSGDQYFVVLTQLNSLPSFDRANVLPVLTGAAIDEGQQAIGTLLDRLAGVRTNALADEMSVALTDSHKVRGTSPYGVWVMPLGNSGTVSASNGVAGYSTQGGGLMAGIDTEWMRSVSIGVALGYTNNFVRQTDGNAGTISMPRLAVYGGWWHGPFALDAVVGIGMGQIDATRPVASPSLFETAYSNHVANEKSAAIQASAAFAFDGWVIGPALGAKYLYMTQTGFTESGTDLYNFSAAAQTTNSLRPYANLLFSKRFMISDHWALVPELKVGMEHEVSDSVRRVTVQTAGDAYDWNYAGLLTGADLLRLDGGLKLETSRAAAFFVDYNHLQSSSTTNQYVSGGFRYRL